MRTRLRAASSLVLLALLLLGAWSCGPSERGGPRLLVTVVVDGLSTAQLLRHRGCFGEEGFERFFREGAWFPRARLAHSTTFTGPSHGTIATGATPAEHGLVGNTWYERDGERRRYCAGDPQALELGGSSGGDRGSSCANLLVPTLADVLRERLDGRSRSLGVSIKDRGAVLGAGHEGDAWWYDGGSGRFVTSTFFRSGLPPWWEEYYAREVLEPYRGRLRDPGDCEQPWHEEHARSVESVGPDDPRRTTSTRLPAEAGSRLYYTLRESPWGDRATFDFLQVARRKLEVGGSGQRVDQLFVSFSALDYVQHDLGPDAPGATAVIVELDRILAELFVLLDREVGVGAWTLALTADHGYPPTPELSTLRGMPAGRLDPEAMAEHLDAHLDATYGEEDWVEAWTVPTYTLRRSAVQTRGLDFAEVQDQGREALLEVDGVFEVARRHRLESGTYDGPFAAGVRNSFHPERSGDLLVLQDRGWYLLYDPHGNACTHGSPWEYDREVPLLLLGRGVRAGEFETPAEIRDLAPTLLAIAGEAPAESMSGRVLREAMVGLEGD